MTWFLARLIMITPIRHLIEIYFLGKVPPYLCLLTTILRFH